MGNASLSATEGAWNSASSTLDGWEQCVQDTLTCQKGVVTWKLLGDWSRVTHWPKMRHVNIDLFAVSLFKNGDGLTDIILTCGHHFDETTSDFGGDHNSMFIE